MFNTFYFFSLSFPPPHLFWFPGMYVTSPPPLSYTLFNLFHLSMPHLSCTMPSFYLPFPLSLLPFHLTLIVSDFLYLFSQRVTASHLKVFPPLQNCFFPQTHRFSISFPSVTLHSTIGFKCTQVFVLHSFTWGRVPLCVYSLSATTSFIIHSHTPSGGFKKQSSILDNFPKPSLPQEQFYLAYFYFNLIYL